MSSDKGLLESANNYICEGVEKVNKMATSKSYYTPISKDDLFKHDKEEKGTESFVNSTMKKIKNLVSVETTEDIVEENEKELTDEGMLNNTMNYIKKPLQSAYNYVTGSKSTEHEKSKVNEKDYKAKRKLGVEKAMDDDAPILDRISSGIDAASHGTLELTENIQKQNAKAKEEMDKEENEDKGYIVSAIDSVWNVTEAIGTYCTSIIHKAENSAKENIHKSEREFEQDNAMNSQAPIKERIESGANALLHANEESNAQTRQEHHDKKAEEAKEEIKKME